MFALLTTLPTDVSVDAAYYLVRLLRYKKVLLDLTRAQVLRKGSQPPSAETMQAINELLKEIETAEGGRIEDLPDSTIEKYIIEISNIIQERSAKESGYSVREGKRLLDQLRQADNRT